MHASTHIPADENVVAGRHYLTSFGPITASSIQDGLSSMLVCRVFRDAGNATDNYEHDAGLLEIDFHYATNRPGSKGETSR
jgi:hypothetical protein